MSTPIDSQHMLLIQVSSAGHLRLRDITLSRIPHLRSFVNDALLDVLYFMSPAYHQVRTSHPGILLSHLAHTRLYRYTGDPG